MMRATLPISLTILLYACQPSDALFFGCGCRQCGCAYSNYPAYQPSYQPAYPPLSPYPPGPIAGYILRSVGPAYNSGYVVPGGQSGTGGVPVIHNKYGHIGYLQTRDGNIPTNGPLYWQRAEGVPYEMVSLGRLLR